MNTTTAENTTQEAAGEKQDCPNRYRSIWISDIHLGTRGCKSDFLLDFLKNNDSDFLYLVGDIIDGWQLRRSWYWTQNHNNVVQKILRKVRKGTVVTYIPGNHDEFLHAYHSLQFGGVNIAREAQHTTRDGRKFLVIHGDQFDGIVRNSRWLALLGSNAYDRAIDINNWFNYFRLKFGYSYWSLSAYLKHKVKNAVGYITSYENIISQEARKRRFDGVICGHIHKAEIKKIDGILYCNDGDWVESCTALVENLDGTLEILQWTDVKTKISC